MAEQFPASLNGSRAASASQDGDDPEGGGENEGSEKRGSDHVQSQEVVQFGQGGRSGSAIRRRARP